MSTVRKVARIGDGVISGRRSAASVSIELCRSITPEMASPEPFRVILGAKRPADGDEGVGGKVMEERNASGGGGPAREDDDGRVEVRLTFCC